LVAVHTWTGHQSPLKAIASQLKFVLLVLAASLCHYEGFAQDIHFTQVDPPKGSAWGGVRGMSQDPQGYLWIATSNGLYKYDGHQYTAYLNDPFNPNSVARNRLESIFADRNGIIWIGTFGSGLDRFDPITNKFTHYQHQPGNQNSLADNRITAIIADHEGIIWLGTFNGVDEFDPRTGLFKHFVHNDKDPNSISNNQVRVIYEDRQGTIWVGTGSPFPPETPIGEGGLNKVDKKTGKFTRYLHNPTDPNSLIDNRVRAIFEDSRGIFWVGTSGDGLHTMDRKKGTFARHLYDPAHPEKLSRPPLKKTITFADDHITFINEDNSGKIWIGTFEGGINVYDPITQKTVWYGADASKKKIANNDFWAAYKTRDGILWIAGWDPQLYKINPYQNKLPYYYMGKWVVAFWEHPNGTLWMATDKGLVRRLSDNTEQTFYIDKKNPFKKIPTYDIEPDNENNIWLATWQGLYQFDYNSGNFTGYRHVEGNPNSLITDSVYCMEKGAVGKLWVGTTSGLEILDIKTGIFKHFLYNSRDTTSISNNIINIIRTDHENNIWVGTYNGLNKLDEKSGHFKRYLANNENIYAVKNDSRGNLWVGTTSGLLKYDKNKDAFSFFNNTEGFAVYDITEDHEKNLWLSTSAGIVKLNLQNNEANVYGKSQGVNTIPSQNYEYTLHDGEILLGDTSGYFQFQPDKLLHRVPAPNTAISSFLLTDVPVLPAAGGVLDKPILSTKEILLNYSQSMFSFGFSTIDFVGGEGDIRSFYMLENYERKWREANAGELANYYNVPPGNYIFKVKSINSDGGVTIKQIDIVISPPWWQTWWAYALFVFVFAGSIWAFIYYRSRRLIKEKRLLEHKVQIRTEEVLQQKEEIEAQRDSLEKSYKELKLTQTQLIQSEKMASLGELTAGIAHEIQNPLNFVNNFSEVNTELIDELKYDIINGNIVESLATADNIQENQQKINHHGKRADAIVKAMLQHSRSSSGQKEPTNMNALADEYLRLAYHGLRAKDKSFNAITETHFDKSIGAINISPPDIGRVILNLLNNAFYAVNEKKKLHPEGYEPTVTISTRKSSDQISISVRDNGNGIPQKILDKIYQPFFTTKPTGQGTGLGLSMSYDIIKAHGGELRVETLEGEFAEFTITLLIT